MMNKMNQKGALAIIYIIATVVIVLAVIVVAFQLTVKPKPKAFPAPKVEIDTQPTFASQGCKDMDYTGCDGPEWATWTDDGKR